MVFTGGFLMRFVKIMGLNAFLTLLDIFVQPANHSNASMSLKTPLNPWVLVMTSKFNSVIATVLKISTCLLESQMNSIQFHPFPFHLMAVVAWQLRRRNCGSVVIWARFILNPAHSNGQVFDIVVVCCRRSMRPDKLTLERNTNLFCTFWHISNV